METDNKKVENFKVKIGKNRYDFYFKILIALNIIVIFNLILLLYFNNSD